MTIPHITTLPSMSEAISCVEKLLLGGFDPDADPLRTITDLSAGQLLLMPSEAGPYAGVKIASVAPGNPARGLPRITALYLLLDAATLTPLATLDGTALTNLRTAAVSAVAVKHLAAADASRLVVFGTGPQARAHIEAVRAVRPIETVTVVGRSRVQEFAASVGARCGTPDDVADADVVVCCTTARSPLFDGALVGDGVTVVAVGSHEPDKRETDTGLVRRATVVVESVPAALREAGDLLVPLRGGHITPDHVAGSLAGLVTGGFAADPGRPRLFKSVGMAWEDLAVAGAAYERDRK